MQRRGADRRTMWQVSRATGTGRGDTRACSGSAGAMREDRLFADAARLADSGNKTVTLGAAVWAR